MYMPGDKVKYVGRTLNVSSKVGEVIAKVVNEPNAFIVEFGDDSYVVSLDSLARHYMAQGSDSTYTPRRRRDADLDDE